MKVFLDYSKYYDLLYKDKDYKKECEFISTYINKFSPKAKSILSLGCGTCNHELILAKKNFSIVGIDMSRRMLKIAREKIKINKFGSKIKVYEKDVRKFNFENKFDLSIAMFNIVGYQNTNKDFEKMLKNVSNNLKNNGIFMFDCWYMPAVLKNGPTNKIKVINVGSKKIVRRTFSRLDLNKNLIRITFNISEIRDKKVISKTTETHIMRYWSLPELEYFLEKTGFSILYVCNFMNKDQEISDKYWNIFVVARYRQ
ncbi:MAG: class I SAM-dependent methyltransferase [Actinomycetota bacterium]